MRVLLLSAYAAGSHEYWARALQTMFTDWDWQVLSLPPRHFSWRVRGNPLYWSQAQPELLEQPYDLLIATSMVDLATLRGLVPSLAGIPSLLYFHENQFAYPQDRQRHSLLEAQMVSIYSALAADGLAFNSTHNRDTFLQGVTDLLARLPDFVPPGVVQGLAARSRILPVPLQVPGSMQALMQQASPVWSARTHKGSPLRLVWVGRQEHDKGGQELLDVLHALEQLPLEYELAIVGQQFRRVPQAFIQLQSEFQQRLVHYGYLDSRDDYLAVLGEADIVLSTARHEFQGLAVMEAVACGCLPVLPRRLAYPEFFPECFLYHGDSDDAAAAAAQLIARLSDCLDAPAHSGFAVPDLSGLWPGQLRPDYQATLVALKSGKDSH